ncbi:MAG TPA: GspH/FimT family pseudopilin [Aquabacterium sp.]|uniref:GspH/FimT family pseudopilin n=1 Tax=Aquabacterium sp. TaxID=1872578 RepID=UPI002E34F377|nr:GspH/FimT family pseudopilin [Aquabacterium sp.]HEX5357721.1 GspH/FimT family pseudopilin [Aquabacterium sp.]
MEKYRNSEGSAAQQRGFTLTELLVTMAIVVILFAIGAPQLQTFLIQRTVDSQADTFAASVRLARSEAIKRGVRVSMCASTNPTATLPVCAAAGAADWSRGWLVWVDDVAPARSYNAGETIVKVQQAFNSSGNIASNGGNAVISFTQNGMALANNGSFQVHPHMTGTEATEPANNRCVVVSVAGRVQVKKGAC